MTPSLAPDLKLTPMMEQYRSIKKKLPQNTILFFRLGDFYEMFFEDAVCASEILDITLTGREGGNAGRVPMCGIPYHAFQGYVRTLVDHNFKVAICDQVGDPKASKGLVERKISRIVSPATNLDEEVKGREPEYMLAITREGQQFALAYLDMGTGDFYVREVPGDRLLSEISLISPREMILPKSLVEDEEWAGPIKENFRASFTVYEDWIFEYDEGKGFVRETFRLASENTLSFWDHALSVGACGAVLYYLKDHLHSSLGHLRLPILLDSREFMVLDRQTQRSLELVSSLSGRKDSGNLFSCIDRTLTSMGGRTLHQWMLLPLLSLPAIQKRQDGNADLIQHFSDTQTLRNLLKGVKDVERTLSRLHYGVANARDLVNLKFFLERIPEIKKCLKTFSSSMIQEMDILIRPFPELESLIAKSIADQPPLGLKDGGLIRDGFSSDLDELRRIAKEGKTWLVDFERRQIERTGIRSLKIKYSQVFGYTIDVSKANLHLVPSEYIRRQTLANAERFLLPELKQWDEKISGAQDKIKMLEFELFNQVRGKVLEFLSPLQTMAKAIGVLDALSSLALCAVEKRWVRPEIVDTNELSIREGRHPVVESMLPSGKFVENDTLLTGQEDQLIVLTGPNMAGKSTYIRQVAQIVLLGQIGSYVPAAFARIGIVDRIFTRIGASDDLARGESTFMVEMVEMSQILNQATSRSLLVLDEVGRGTSTFDGVSIAWAICEFLVTEKVRPRTLFATHYHELTQLEEHFPGIRNYNITVKETKQDIIFLRKVVRGGSDRSYGIHVAKLAGIPQKVTNRAEEILNILEAESIEATQIIEGKPDHEGKPSRVAPTQQMTFFESPRHPLLEEIGELALEEMTPLQVFNRVADWKKRLSGDAGEKKKE